LYILDIFAMSRSITWCWVHGRTTVFLFWIGVKWTYNWDTGSEPTMVWSLNTSVRDDCPRVLKSRGLMIPVLFFRDTLIRDTISCHHGTVNATFMTETPVILKSLSADAAIIVWFFCLLHTKRHHRIFVGILSLTNKLLLHKTSPPPF
jgi:hypothetical protein